ncbi:protein kinase [Candidatus Omnitrophus magneticus]|uniref:Protein kinase n=1 Tax=Candidatus Omnitrophus magneticus TaxID=1609969 RepID=A0A0F0CMP2_9BACT|nr:protein kinase [Candidatus Omnitrophus magneticus]
MFDIRKYVQTSFKTGKRGGIIKFGKLDEYSMFFPIILVPDSKKYIKEGLLKQIKNRMADDDSYGLASLEALNTFCIEYAMERVSPNFDEKRINAILSKINSLSDKEIKQLAIKFWRDPKQYFTDVAKGYYYQNNITIKGANGEESKFTLSNGQNVNPRIKIIETKEIELPKEPETEKPKDKEYEEEKKQREKSIFEAKALPDSPRLRQWIEKYQKLFAPDDDTDELEVKYVSEGGTDINPEAWASRDADQLLIAPEYEDEEKTLAQNVFFIIDVSGSIKGNPDLQKAIENMIYHYSSLLLELSRKNPDLNVGIATISDRLDVLFTPSEWKKTRSHSACRTLLEKSLNEMWDTGTGGGIDTPKLLDKLSLVEFPLAGAKDIKNLVVVMTDGGETGRAQGKTLQEMINNFREVKYTTPDGKTQIHAGKHKQFDMAFVGAALQDQGHALKENYPCFLDLGSQGEESSDIYFEGLLKMAYLQAKNIPLEGNLSETIRTLGKKLEETRGEKRSTFKRSVESTTLVESQKLGTGTAVTLWLKRLTPSFEKNNFLRMIRTLVIAPVLEETIYRALPLAITALVGFFLTGTLDWHDIFLWSIPAQIIFGIKFLLDHFEGTNIREKIQNVSIRESLIPGIVTIFNTLILPTIFSLIPFSLFIIAPLLYFVYPIILFIFSTISMHSIGNLLSEIKLLDYEKSPTGNISAGFSSKEETALRKIIEQDSDKIRDENKNILEIVKERALALLTREQEIREILSKQNIPREQIDTIIGALKSPSASFKWFNAIVESPEKYLLGHESALAVNVIQHILETENTTGPKNLLDEYILYESLEKTNLDHKKIIKLTSLFFNRGTYEKPSETPLEKTLREFINKESVKKALSKSILDSEVIGQVWDGMKMDKIIAQEKEIPAEWEDFPNAKWENAQSEEKIIDANWEPVSAEWEDIGEGGIDEIKRILSGHIEEVTHVNTIIRDTGEIIVTSSSYDKTVRVWQIGLDNQIKVLTLEGHEDYVKHAHTIIKNTGEIIVTSASADRTMRVWQIGLDNKIKVLTLVRRSYNINHVHTIIKDTGEIIVTSASDDKTVRVWQIGRDNQIKVLKLKEHTRVVAHVHTIIKEDTGEILVTSASNDKTVRVWQIGLDNKIKVLTLEGHTNIVIDSHTIIKDTGEILVTSASMDKTVRVLQIGQDNKIKVLTLIGHADGVQQTQTIIKDTGEIIVTSTSSDGTVRIWQIGLDNKIKVLILEGHTDWIKQAQTIIKDTGEIIVTSASDDKTVRVWQIGVDNKIKVLILEGHTYWVKHAHTIIKDTGEIIVTSASADATVRIWQIVVDNKIKVLILKGHTNWVKHAQTIIKDTGEIIVTSASATTQCVYGK